jgi:predicted DNA-binding transcriptional regulator YafY
MDKKYTFERFYWLEGQIKRGKYPKRKDIAERYGITERQVSRDVKYMKEFLNAPIKYSTEEEGYIYTEESYELPKPKVTEKEIIAFMIAECLADSIPARQMLKDMDSLVEKLSLTAGFNLNELKKKVSLKNIRCGRVDTLVFETVLQALNTNNKLEIEYHAQYKSEISFRTVNPLHLLLYMGNWYLYAFCEKKDGYRTFALSGIKKVEMQNQHINDNLKEKDVRKIIDESYGIFINDSDRDKVEVLLEFDASIASRIRDQVWINSQQMEEKADGSLQLRLFISDFTEISEEILRYSPHVRVLHPVELINQIKKIISQMSSLYSDVPK